MAERLDSLSRILGHYNGDLFCWREFDPDINDLYNYEWDEDFNFANTYNNLDHGGSQADKLFHLVYHLDHSSPVSMGTSTVVAHQLLRAC